jgi:polyhydroxybutyrate depolymerase
MTLSDDIFFINPFAVVYPQGTRYLARKFHWNADLDLSETDDVGFLTSLAEHLQEEHIFDSERTYISGISNGGLLSYTVACQQPETFKAMASIIRKNEW